MLVDDKTTISEWYQAYLRRQEEFKRWQGTGALGKLIKGLRQILGEELTHVAARAHIPYPKLAAFEEGYLDFTDITREEINSICKALGTDPESMIAMAGLVTEEETENLGVG